jgi:hypothetical protein
MRLRKWFVQSLRSIRVCSMAGRIVTTLLPKIGEEGGSEFIASTTSQNQSTAIPTPAITSKRVKKRCQ